MPFLKGHGRLRSPESYRTQDRSFMTLVYRQRISELAKSKGYGQWMNGKRLSVETKVKISQSMRGKNLGSENPMHSYNFSEEQRRHNSEAHKGSKTNFWRGGICPINAGIRSSYDADHWRREVFKRDDYICQECGKRGGRLHAHHIKSFSQYPELRFEVSNGETLCKKCHQETGTYLKVRQQVEAIYHIVIKLV